MREGGTGSALREQDIGPAPRRNSSVVPKYSEELTAERVMMPCTMCVQEDLSIEAARRIFGDNKIAQVPVVDRTGRPVGFLSRAALVRAPRRGAKEVVVGQLMAKVQVTVSAWAALSLVELLVERYCGAPLPVVDEDGRLLGLIDGTLAGAAWRFRR